MLGVSSVNNVKAEDIMPLISLKDYPVVGLFSMRKLIPKYKGDCIAVRDQILELQRIKFLRRDGAGDPLVNDFWHVYEGPFSLGTFYNQVTDSFGDLIGRKRPDVEVGIHKNTVTIPVIHFDRTIEESSLFLETPLAKQSYILDIFCDGELVVFNKDNLKMSGKWLREIIIIETSEGLSENDIEKILYFQRSYWGSSVHQVIRKRAE